MKLKLVLAFGIAFVVTATSNASAQTSATHWSGFYVGGNVGYGWGAANSSQSGGASSFSGAPTIYVPNSYSVATTSEKTALDNLLGGVQVGYNFSSNRWVVGAEADVQFGRRVGNVALVSPLSGRVCNLVDLGTGQCGSGAPFPSAVNGPVSSTLESSIDWFGTIRGRLGYLVSDNLLLFGTGGLAYGRVAVSSVTNVSVSVANGLIFEPNSASASASKTNIGFALGAGLEGRFVPSAPNWSWKLEYLYVDLGSLDTTATFALSRPAGSSAYYTPITGPAATHTRFTDNILRFGVNYRIAP